MLSSFNTTSLNLDGAGHTCYCTVCLSVCVYLLVLTPVFRNPQFTKKDSQKETTT